jgi:hypothetical protein
MIVGSGNTTFATSSLANQQAFLGIGLGGLIVGVLDLIYAILVYSPHRPILIPQTIASGVLGAKSYQQGMASAALGIVLHFVISFGAATTYYLASRKLTFLTSRAILFGMLYGAAVYFFMHLIVLPLSAAPHRQTQLIYALPEFVEHCFCVGLPIALSVRYYSP